MGDASGISPGGQPSRGGRRRRRGDRRRRWPLLLVLLALGVGAAAFGPGLLQFGKTNRVRPRVTQQAVRPQRPRVHQPWRFDFSMGPILELVEQSLNLRPFDLRRPVRIPVTARGLPQGGNEILLADPASFVPGLGPTMGGPLAALPAPQLAGLPDLFDLPPFHTPGAGVPTNEPDFDPDLLDGDEELPPPGRPLPPHRPPRPPRPPPPPVPEPALGVLLASILGALALRRR